MAETNGRTSAQIEYTLQRVGAPLRVRETSVDIVNGQLAKVFRGRTSEVRFRNYLQISGVRGGENQLRLRLEQSGRTRVERVEVFGDSGVFRTSGSPYPLRLVPCLSAGEVHPDKTFRVVARLSNRTGEPVRNVEVRPVFDRRAFELLLPGVRRYAAIAKSVDPAFAFRPLRVGRHRIDILASRAGTIPVPRSP